jgi:hypothetical protein
MASTSRAATDGSATGPGRRFRLASPATAVALGILLLASLAVFLVISVLLPGQNSTSTSNVTESAAGVAFVLAFTAVGVVVARREPRNPMGWLLIAVPLAVQAGSIGPAYAYLDYKVHHGMLPLGRVAILLSGAWEYAILLLPLVILLFPDGRPGPRWRWPLRAYLALCVVFVAGTLAVAVEAFGLRRPVDANGNLVGLSHPVGAVAWVGPVQSIGFAACAVLVLAAVGYQALSYRRATGERRQQLKCLGAGAGTLIACFAVNSATGGGSGLIGDVSFSVGFTALPVAMGVGILRYRLYEIDRLVSRTLTYAILTALLVGAFIGLIALTTNTLAFSSRVGVAASTLIAAALFNPLRKRIQRVVDRRFNRARYDAEATVAAFTARLRDAVEIDAIRADLLDAVNRAVQPTHASVWIRQGPSGQR